MEVLREILVDLLNPEKAAKATGRMKGVKNDPQLLPNLMQLTLADSEPSVRQMAAVILRKDISRKFGQLKESDQAMSYKICPFFKMVKKDIFNLKLGKNWQTPKISKIESKIRNFQFSNFANFFLKGRLV